MQQMPSLVDAAQFQQYSSAPSPSSHHPQWLTSPPDSPLSGSLSPLSQFTFGRHKPSASSSSSSSATVIVRGAAPPAWKGTPHPSTALNLDPHNRRQSSPRSPSGYHAEDPNTWNWAQQWFPNRNGAFHWPPDASPSPSQSPASSFRGSSLSLTQNQTLARHDSSGTISSKGSSGTRSSDSGALVLYTGRPPQHWRADFKMPRTGLAAIMNRKRRSLAYPENPNPKAVLSPYLRYSSPDTPVYWDIQSLPSNVVFRDLQMPPASGDFTRFVCEPPQCLMRIYHSRMPWYVDVQANLNPVGVTFADLFNTIYQSLQIPIVDVDYYNDELTDDERKMIAHAYQKRCGSDHAELAKGVRRVDYLMGRVIFDGLVKGKGGLWEMKTRPVSIP